ncbi:MAG: RNA polymerase subunit sigma-70 [Flavobacterium sp. BFFFF2]|nr:MAG: RNA polymerase subunit sigma-70 [Flavobacterium sp. BFFFF2]
MEIGPIIDRALLGEQSAFTFLLDHYWGEVFGFMIKRTENETDAEDITMETFAKAFGKINQYNREFQFNTWLIAIAKNVHIDHIRREKHHVSIDMNDEDESRAMRIPDDSPSAEDQLIIEQNLSLLLRYIKELKPHYQEVIQLRYFQELSYQEISNQLNEPLSNVKIKLMRAKKLLADIIDSHQPK